MRVGILTGGGDAPGLNAAIRAVATLTLANGGSVVQVRDGWKGLVGDGDLVEMEPSAFEGILNIGGTILGSSRTNPMKMEGGVDACLRNIERAGTVSLTELGRMAELDRSTVGRNVKVLERLRLVRLMPAKDQREAAVSLTAAGRETIRHGAPLWDEAQRRIETVLGVDGAEQLRILVLSL